MGRCELWGSGAGEDMKTHAPETVSQTSLTQNEMPNVACDNGRDEEMKRDLKPPHP
ncbi:hypothetical protein EI77_01973 [Prosthecobacter fusiformis]|uniref:Uncharacterized protein n=1 Tax=Prosthecobacter fusiformis TaxID=48464 RepID=A0A4R7S103_9BACT|nr:hypothetical protein EI77_01973 [Prosthecobacter fusiformis]